MRGGTSRSGKGGSNHSPRYIRDLHLHTKISRFAIVQRGEKGGGAGGSHRHTVLLPPSLRG